jgi:hypothetical protein
MTNEWNSGPSGPTTPEVRATGTAPNENTFEFRVKLEPIIDDIAEVIDDLSDLVEQARALFQQAAVAENDDARNVKAAAQPTRRGRAIRSDGGGQMRQPLPATSDQRAAAEALIEELHAALTAKWAGLGDPGLAELEALAEGIRLLRFRFGCRSADFLLPVLEGGNDA